MSQENVERILRGYAALNRGDLDGAVRGVSHDCEVALPPMLPEANSYQGRDGLKRMWAVWRDSFDDFRMEVEEVIDGGDK
jgi:ketosteroid isomerase-like protein